jgi:hypothetical protein
MLKSNEYVIWLHYHLNLRVDKTKRLAHARNKPYKSASFGSISVVMNRFAEMALRGGNQTGYHNTSFIA